MPSYPLPTGPGMTAARGSLKGANSASLTVFSASQTSVQCLSENPDRVGAYFYNNAQNNAYLLYSVASATVGYWSYKITSGSSWSISSPPYVGPISLIWDGIGTGSLMVTEMSSPTNY